MMESRVEERTAAPTTRDGAGGAAIINQPIGESTLALVTDPGSKVIRYADIVMDLGAMQASRSGRPVKLNATELRLLKLLLEQPERAFTREQLKAAVWGRGVKLDLRTINAYLGRLRRALNANGDANVIRTITGYGYSIDATCSDVR